MNAIKNAFLHLWAFLTGLGAKELTYIETYVVPVLQKEAGQIIVQLAPTALSIVTTMATTGDLPNAKRDAAVAELKKAALSAGIDAATSVLNNAVENAVQALKAGQSTSNAGTATS